MERTLFNLLFTESRSKKLKVLNPNHQQTKKHWSHCKKHLRKHKSSPSFKGYQSVGGITRPRISPHRDLRLLRFSQMTEKSSGAYDMLGKAF